jgi:16S rRNA (adenine1518-N6/adenine1519-N6)-dimethyltransferase
VKVVEIDPESIGYLQTHFSGLTVISGDFLKINIQEIFNNQEFSIIGNFPYNISSQIVFKTIENKEFIPEFAGMFQKEVAERIASAPGSKTYGILSVLMQTFYDIRYCFSVSEKSFLPPPKVKSGVIHCLRKTGFQIPVNEKLFFDVVKTAFNQRRKTLRNSLSKFGEIPSKYQPLRAEQLHYSDFIEITKSIAEK